MSPQTKKLLEKFATDASWGALAHPNNMELFWDFVISAYRNNEHDISLDDFLEVLDSGKKNEKFSQDEKFFDKKKEIASKMFMFNQYEDGIKLLLRFDKEVLKN